MSPLDFLNSLPIPPIVRKWLVYFFIPLAVLVYGVWQASDGDWKAFWPALGTAIVGVIAHAFTTIQKNPTDYAGEYTGEVSGNPEPVTSTDDTNLDNGSDDDASAIYGDGADRGVVASGADVIGQENMPATPAAQPEAQNQVSQNQPPAS
jgi:hypothetical protein